MIVSLHRTLARDRRLVAIHEAGHFTVARHFGLRSATAQIIPANTTGPQNYKLWLGSCSLPECDRLSERRRVMFAVAGAIAEYAWATRHDPDSSWGYGFHDEYWEEAVSATDWRMAGCLPDDLDRATRKV